MAESLDWDQPARLMTISTATRDADGSLRRSGPTVATGTLAQVVEAYKQMPQRLIARASIVIAGGFHLDGGEIDDLIGGRSA